MPITQSSSSMLSPVKYLDIANYFADYFLIRRKNQPGFTYEEWAEELGFKSKSYLRMICSGDRLATQKLVYAFAEKNFLDSKQTTHLELMALYQKAETESEKKIYLDKIFETLQPEIENIEVRKYIDFLSDVQLPTLQMLLTYEDGPKIDTEIAEALNIDLKTTHAYLMKLKNIGIVSDQYKNGKIFWTATNTAFDVADKYLDQALKVYYNETLKEVKLALDLKIAEKRFRSVFFALNEEDFKIFAEESEAFLTKMRNRFQSSSVQGKSVFKVNLFSYPVTKKITK